MDKLYTLSMFLTLCLCVSRAVGDGKNGDTERTSSRRAADANPLQPVVNQLTQKVEQLQAELQALKYVVTNTDTTVGFTARFSEADVFNLRLEQPVVFDFVSYNAGGGYDKTTGIFTAPASGMYVFALGIQRHGSDEDTVIMRIMKGTEILAAVEAGYSPYEHGSMAVTTHLNEGETIAVKTHHGSVVYGAHSTIFTGFRISS